MTGARLAGVWLAACALVVSPLLWAAIPPLVDYPNHLARAWILTHAASVPELAANYVVNFRVLPDLAMDGGMLLLSHLLPFEVAGRVFIALAMLSPVAGTVALHHALHGRVGLWPLAALLAVYNTIFFWGFLSCLFSIGMALCLFAGWVATRTWPVALRVVLFAPAAMLLLLGHLFAFGLYGLLVASFELGELIGRRRFVRAGLLRALALGLQFVPALALFWLSLTHGGPTHTEYGNPLTKLIALLTPFTFGHGPGTLDGLTWAFAVVALYVGVSRRYLGLSPLMRVPLIVLALAAVAMPNWLAGAWAADLRLPATLPFLLVASTAPRPLRAGLGRAVMLAAAALLAVRVWAVSTSFASYDRWFADFRAAAAALPPGARLLMVEPKLSGPRPALPGLPQALGRVEALSFLHVPALAILDRSAFYPNLFTGWTTVDATPRNLPIAEPQGMPLPPDDLWRALDPAEADAIAAFRDNAGDQKYWRNWPEDFDYVMWMSFQPGAEHVPPQLEPVAAQGWFTLYRIRR